MPRRRGDQSGNDETPIEEGEIVNFWDFAGLFLKLGCKDALFLDGDISQMAVNPGAPVESNRFGAMLVIVE